MCSLFSILLYFSTEPIDHKFVEKQIREYLTWELENIKAGVLTFGKKKKNDLDSDIKYLLRLH